MYRFKQKQHNSTETHKSRGIRSSISISNNHEVLVLTSDLREHEFVNNNKKHSVKSLNLRDDSEYNCIIVKYPR